MHSRFHTGLPVTHVVRVLATAAIAAIVWCADVRLAAAQNGYYVEAGGDYSAVDIGVFEQVWKNARLSGGFFEDGRTGWSATVERQQRDVQVDWSGSARGFRRNGDWTFSGGVGLGADPSFSYRRSYEAELARTVVGSLVAHGGYRYLQFTGATVHLIQPAATLYLPRGEVGARLFVVRNTTRDAMTGTLLVQGVVAVHPRLRLGGGAAFGERIFDIASLLTPDAASWVGFGYARFMATRHWGLDLGVGRAHEDPLFSQQNVTASVRYTFGRRP